jgi:hypothetical protein
MPKIENKEVEKMIASIMKHKECSKQDAIDHMLVVATGRLRALKRYDDSLPEGKTSKGILTTKGNRKRAERSAPVKVVAQ